MAKREIPNDGLNAITRYYAKCDPMAIRPLKEDGEMIRAGAEAAGLSLTKFIVTACRAYVENEAKKQARKEARAAAKQKKGE